MSQERDNRRQIKFPSVRPIIPETSDPLADRVSVLESEIGEALTSPVTDTGFIVQNVTTTSKKFRFDVSSVTGGNTRVLTVPNADSTLATLAGTETLTNKTIDSDSNVITNIVDADIKSGAAIARNKLANGTASHVLINDGSGAMSSEAILAVTRGGTGAATLTANNVILGNTTSAVQFVAPSTSGNLLTSNGTTWASTAPAAPVLSSAIKTASYTILDNDGFSTIYCNAANPTITLPTLADNQNRQITIINIHATGWVIVDGEGSETINGLLSLNLMSKYDFVTLYGQTSSWTVANHCITSDTGYVQSTDSTNRSFGSIEVNYDTQTVAFALGEVVTGGTTGTTGVVIVKTATVLTLKNVTVAAGKFNDNETLTGSLGGSALVNGNTINVDTNFTHLFGVTSLGDIEIKYIYSSGGSDATAGIMQFAVFEASSIQIGVMYYFIDSNTINVKIAQGARFINTSTGATTEIDTSTMYYRAVAKVKRVA